MGAWIILLMHTWCLLLCQAQIPCSENDLNSLISFSQGLTSKIQSWTLNSTDCCSWLGVGCTESRVTSLKLVNMSLRGPITSLANLDQLKDLNLSSNILVGPVPEQLFRIRNLEFLDLSTNDFSGTIPSDTDLPNIQVFNISGNFFNETHPVLRSSQNLTMFDIGYNLFTGSISTSICIDSPKVRVVVFSMNLFTGEFPAGFGKCSLVTDLVLDLNMVSGTLPDDIFEMSSLKNLFLQDNAITGVLSTGISKLTNLTRIDISFNGFSGTIPDVFDSLKNIDSFLAQTNNFNGHLPSSLRNSSTIRMLSLRNNSLGGTINLDFGAMKNLCSLDLSWNSFIGGIPGNIPQSSGLKMLNLGNNNLTGEVPKSLSLLGSLSYLSISKNDISNISSALQILQHCPNLTNLVLTKNFDRGEEIPYQEIQGFKNLEVLVIPNCGLRGKIPLWLSKCKKLKVLDLSWNRLRGEIPSWIGEYDRMFYLDLSNNSLSGKLPVSFKEMKGLIDKSLINGSNTIEDFPFFIRRNNSAKGLQYKQVSSFPPSLILSNNELVGTIPPALGELKMLHVLDLSKNKISGTIPSELSEMSSLETLDLSHNNLSGSIPSSLTSLNFLSNFDVSYNDLVGTIPTGGQFSTFPLSSFDGNPGLRSIHSAESTVKPVHHRRRNKLVIITTAFGIGFGTAGLLAVAYIIVSKSHSKIQETAVKPDSFHEPELVLLFNKDNNEQVTITDILTGTGNFNDANIIGCGGFGLVYRATLKDGRKLAIKRLSGDFGQMEREFGAEIEALSRAQHPNLVPLLGYCRTGNDRLLIYSYMVNGSLDYWLHEEKTSSLTWDMRVRIARGSARGLAYLHLHCEPHILHRDVKSSNILLDENFDARLADFGLARLVLPYDTHVTTDLVGTLGYIPPEYGQSSVATFKGDVYSFGVVLLELVTGKRPMDMMRNRSTRDIIARTVEMRKLGREGEVLDECVCSEENEEEMRRVLDIACLCVNESPKMRPMMDQLVAWLDCV